MQEQLNAYKALYETAKQYRELIEDSHFRSIEEKVQELHISSLFNMKLKEAGYYWYENILDTVNVQILDCIAKNNADKFLGVTMVGNQKTNGFV